MNKDKTIKKLHEYRWYIFLILVCCYFFVYFHRMTVGILGKDIVDDVGGTVGILSSVYFWTYTAMQIPSGLLADRLGPRKSTFIFMTIAAIGSLLTAFGNTFWIIVLGKMFIAAGMAIVYIPLMKIISVWFGKKDFPQLNGIVIAVGNVGAIAASAPLEMLSLSIGGWRNVFLFLALITFVLAFLVLAVVRDHPHHIGLPGLEEVDGRPDASKDPSDGKLPTMVGLKLVFSSGRKYWNMALAYFLVYGSIMVFQGTWAKYYFNNSYSFALSVAWFITMIGIGKIISTITIGILNGRGVIKSKRKTMFYGTLCFLAIWGLLWIYAGKIDSYWFWFSVNFLFGFFGGFMSLSFTQVKEWYPISLAGTAVSATNVFLFLGSSICTTIAAAVMGSTYQLNDFKTLWMLMFFAVALAVILIYFSVEKGPEDELITIE